MQKTTHTSCPSAHLPKTLSIVIHSLIIASSIGSVWANSASATLPEMVVTGEKTDRSIFDTASSVEVFNDQRISQLPAATMAADLLKLTPNVVDLGTGNELPSIRGIDGSGPAQGAIAYMGGTKPRFNVSLDGRSFGYNEQAFAQQTLWDIEQVEVFRGPQSHIQGRNALAGAMILKSKDPTYHWEGAVKLGAANQQYRQTSVMISGPLVDEQLAFRLSVDKQQRESYVHLQKYDNVDPREVETTSTRAKLLFEPQALPELSTKLTFNRNDSHAPQGESNKESKSHVITRPVFENKTDSFIWDFSYALNDQFTFENSLIYSKVDTTRRTDGKAPSGGIDAKEWQIEPVLRFSVLGGDLTGVMGLRYFYGKQDESLYMQGKGNFFDDKTRTMSAFAEATYALTSSVDLTLAGRFEREHHKRFGGGDHARVSLDETYNVFMPKMDIAWKPEKGQTYGFQVSKGYNSGGAGVAMDTSPMESYVFDPEYVWNYELYTRQLLLQDRLELTANLFYNDYQDMQLPYQVTPRKQVILNADKVHTYGLEVSSRWIATQNLELFSAFGLLKSKIKSFNGYEVEGSNLARAPATSFSVGMQYQLPWDLMLSADAKYTSSYYSQFDNDNRGKIDAYWMANMQLKQTFNWGNVSLYAKNLFDSNKKTFIYRNDRESYLYTQPRMLGAAVEVNF